MIVAIEKESSAEMGRQDYWSRLRLGDICEIIRGVTYKKEQASEQPAQDSVPILRATNIQDGVLVIDRDLVFVLADVVSENQKLRVGDIVVATSSGSKHLVGKTAQVKELWTGSFGAFCAALRPIVEIDHRYLGYFFGSKEYKDYITNKALGVNINNLRRSDLEEISVPVAPLDQQKLIVAEIEKQLSRLDEAVANLKRVKANLKRYKSAVLKAAVEGRLVETEAEIARSEGRRFETGAELLQRILETRRSQWNGKGKYKEPAAPDTTYLPELPEGWVWSNFERSAERVTVGHVGSMKDEYVEKGIPFLRSQNVRANRYDSDGLKFVSAGFHRQLAKSTLRPGDIVVVRSGSVGVSCVIPEHLHEANCSDLVIIKNPQAVLPDFGAYYMNSVVETRVAAGKVGVALTHFNTQSVAVLPLPVPPMAEQRRIVAEVDRRLSLIREVETQVNANLKRAERLRQSILQQAFSGKLVVEAASCRLNINNQRQDAAATYELPMAAEPPATSRAEP